MKKIKKCLLVLLSVIMTVSFIEGAFVVSATVDNKLRFYLTSDYRISSSGTSDQTNASLGYTPQIKIAEGTPAKIVIETERLSRTNSAVISYAQNGGILNVKLCAFEDAFAQSGRVLAETEITNIAANYITRLSDLIEFNDMAACAVAITMTMKKIVRGKV